jgi:hypothetical protein
MTLYTNKKLTIIAVFSFLTLLTATSMCSAQEDQGNQGDQDSAWLDSSSSNLKVLNQDQSNIVDALDNNDQEAISKAGLALYQHCENALDESASYQVSDEYTEMKELYETYLSHLRTAAIFISKGDNAQAKKYMQIAVNDLKAFKESVAEKTTATGNTDTDNTDTDNTTDNTAS